MTDATALDKRIRRHVIGPPQLFFAATAPGIEPICAAELAACLPGVQPRPMRGGVSFKARLDDAFRANLMLRTANRVLMRIARFEAAYFSQLEKALAAVPWELYLARETPVVARVATRKSRLHHSGAIAQRLAAAVAERRRNAIFNPLPAPPDRPAEQTIFIRAKHDRFTVSLDTSGELLHKRGLKADVGPAPLRETLAAAILEQVDYTGDAPLLDPMCGGGTFVLEAAMHACRIPVGWHRDFVFTRWPAFRPHRWAHLRRTLAARRRPAPGRQGAAQMGPAVRPKGGPTGEDEITVPPDWNPAGVHGRFQNEGAATAHRVEQGGVAGVVDLLQDGRRQGLPERGRPHIGLESPLVKQLAAGIQRDGKTVMLGTDKNRLLRGAVRRRGQRVEDRVAPTLRHRSGQALGDGAAVMQARLAGGHPGNHRRFPCQIQFPGNCRQGFFQLAEIGGLEAGDTHQDTVGGAQHQVGPESVVQAGLEGDPATHRPGLDSRKACGQLGGADRLNPRCRRGKKQLRRADDVPANAFVEGGGVGHGGGGILWGRRPAAGAPGPVDSAVESWHRAKHLSRDKTLPCFWAPVSGGIE
ncbi:MAG TPA: hypothetical protein ENF48_02195 [Desulfobacteraceae bacterium]|nr:hypothetical protein [Desulfobacteraceae bacterium]